MKDYDFKRLYTSDKVLYTAFSSNKTDDIMPHIFTTSRLSKGNSVFPITIEIDNRNLYCHKGFILGLSKVVVPISHIASVGVVNNVVFSDLIIETLGGKTLFLNGFSHADAQRICHLLQNVAHV